MNIMRISLCFIVVVCVFCAKAGSLYYIDYGAGSDSNDGLSLSTPWKHCPGDLNAAGIPAATTLASGGTVIFKGGVIYSGQIVVRSSGSSGNAITYDGNSAGTWGSGKAILDGDTASNGVGFSIISRSYITIRNFEIRNYGDYTDTALLLYNCTTNPLPNKTGTGIFLQQVSYITVQNNYFHEIGIWQNTSPVVGGDDVSGNGVNIYSGNNIIITGNEFTKMSYGIRMFVYNSSTMNISQVTVSNNNFQNYLRWVISGGVAGANSTFQDINIYSNSIHDYTEYDIGSENSFCSSVPHTDGIIFYIGNSSSAQQYQNNTLGTPQHPIKIYSNSFYNNDTTGGGTAYIFLTTWGGTVYVYDNTFINSHPSGGGEGSIYVQDGLKASDNNPAVDYHFWNNTMFDKRFMIFIRSMTVGSELDRSGYQIDIRNNLMYSYATNPVPVVMESDNPGDGLNHAMPTTMDYNAYYVAGHSSSTAVAETLIDPGPGTDITFVNLYSSLDYEQHGLYGDPQFVNISYGLGLNSSKNNLALQSCSPAIGAGTSLAAYFTTDIFGNTRTLPWDIGAYEYQVIAPVAPTPIYPMNDSLNAPTSPVLSWTTVCGAATYAVQVATVSNFGSTVTAQWGLTAASASVNGLANSATYYWRVGAKNAVGVSGWSSPDSFTTIIAAPAVPALASPANNARNQPISLSLSWNTVSTAASYGVLVSTDVNFGSTVFGQTGISANYAALTGLTNLLTYYWRANAANVGGTSAWSGAWSFTTIIVPPGPPALSLPADSASSQPVSLTLSWSSGSGGAPASYEVQVSTDVAFGSTLLDSGGIPATSQEVGPLSSLTLYYWRAQAANIAGKSSWSGQWSFSTGENYNLWSSKSRITLNTSVSGANVTTNQVNFPVLVRLTSSNAAMVFAGAKSDGSDLRFTKPDGAYLPYELSKYSQAKQRAFVWVLMDTVMGSSAGQSMTMYWGNGQASSRSDSSKVFAPVNGFDLVWHLNKSSGSNPYSFGDATGHGYAGTGYGTVDSPAVIDSGRAFNRTAPIKQDSIVVASLLGSPNTLTLSSWIRVDSIDQRNHESGIISVGNFVALGLGGVFSGGTTKDSLRASYHYGSASGSRSGTTMRYVTGGSAVAGQFTQAGWKHVAYVCNPKGSSPQSALYVNGTLVGTATFTDTVTWAASNHVGRNTKMGEKEGPNSDTSKFFGTMCEARVDNVARSADWIKLCYGNQEAGDMLLNFNPLPSAPILASPANNATNQPTSPTLSWGAVTGAASYSILVSASSGFGTTVTSQTGITGLTATVGGLANNTVYYWEVNATNVGGTSAWSGVWSFTTIAAVLASPVLASPMNGAVALPLALTLSWGTANGAATYSFRVSTSSAFAATVAGQTGMTATVAGVSGLGSDVTYYWEVNATNPGGTGAWSTVWNFTTFLPFNVAIASGWNLVSLNVRPVDSCFDSIIKVPAGPDGFILVKNLAGHVYIPTFGIADIDTVHTGQGYQIFTSANDTIRCQGSAVDAAATPLSLVTGWNLIAYLPQINLPIDTALIGIIPKIEVVKDNAGEVFWPYYGINNIGTMVVGQGYLIYMTDPITLIYDSIPSPAKETASVGARQTLRLPSPRHYAKHANTGNNASVLASRVTFGNQVAPDSCEIGAFDENGNLVGSGTVIHGLAAFPVWGTNTQTKRKDGLGASEKISFKLWNKTGEYPVAFKASDPPASSRAGGNEVRYTAQAIFLGSLSVPECALITKFDLTRAYPNPFEGSVKIAFNVPTIQGVSVHNVEIAVYDLKGRLIAQLAKGARKAGHYLVTWIAGSDKRSAIGSNVYIVRMKAENFEKKLMVIRDGR